MDDVFAEMKADAAREMEIQQKNASMSKAKHRKKGDSVEALMAQAEAKEALRRKKEKKERKDIKAKIAAASKTALDIIQSKQRAEASNNVETTKIEKEGVPEKERVETDSKTVMTRIARDVNSLSDESQSVRRSSIDSIYKVLFEEFTLSVEDYGEIFSDICKPIFKRYSDPVEKIREMAFKITAKFFDAASDFTLVLGYFVPALMARVPSGMAYDEEMKVFVTDMESHEAYRRGKAVDRADKANLRVATVVETSEELRRTGCEILLKVVAKLCQSLDAASILHPYYHEIVVYIARQLRDPYGDVKVLACELLSIIMDVEEFNGGNKYFSVALCRALYPVMRHRLAKVRVAAVNALTVTMAVEDRAKLKGAGTEALPDMVGFREENVLPVAAFYTADVQINYLAEVVADSNHAVRLAVANLLRIFMTEMKDRYDHHTRLLPYLLDLLTDPSEPVRTSALQTLQLCGKQYEDEHSDEIIERRQYGVDGDRRINLEDPLPSPFTESGRPRLGVRLFVRGQIQRFLSALINEVTNWIGTTRLKSANLLKMVVILVEEHLTVEAHMILPAFIKALGFARSDDDKDLEAVLLEVFTLTGRYLLPEVYVHYVLPRLSGDPKVVQFGVDAKTREEVLMLLGCFLRGSQPKEIAPHFGDIVAAITDSFTIDITSHRLHRAAAELLHTLLERMAGHGKAAIEGHFLATGRLTSLRGAVETCYRWLWRSMSDLAAGTSTSLTVSHADGVDSSGSSCNRGDTSGDLFSHLAASFVLLSQLDRDSDMSVDMGGDSTATVSVAYLSSMMKLHGRELVRTLVTNGVVGQLSTEPYVHGEDEELEQQQQRQLVALARSPFFVLQQDSSLLDACLTFVVEVAAGKRGDVDRPTPHNQATFSFLARFFIALIDPLKSTRTSEVPVDALHAAILDAAGADSSTTLSKYSSLSADARTKGLAVLQPRMKALLQLLVLHSRWRYSSSSNLNAEMTSIVKVLCSFKCAGNGGDDSVDDEDEAFLSADTILEMQLLHPLLNALLMISEPSLAVAPTSVSIQKRHASTSLPRSPTDTRLTAVRLAGHLMSICVAAYWRSVPYSRRKAIPFKSSASSSHDLEAMRRTLSPTVATLLLLVDDVDERVREEAANALAIVAPFVDQEATFTSSTETDEAPAAAAVGAAEKVRIVEDKEDDDDEEEEDEEGVRAHPTDMQRRIDHGGNDDWGMRLDLASANLPRVLASALRVLFLQGSTTNLAEGYPAGDSSLAQAVRTLSVLDPDFVQEYLERLEPPASNNDNNASIITSEGVLLAGVLVPWLPPLTLGQRTYKEELGPIRELHKELVDHCALLASLPVG